MSMSAWDGFFRSARARRPSLESLIPLNITRLSSYESSYPKDKTLEILSRAFGNASPDGGLHAVYVAQQLETARKSAETLEVGESFEYALTDLPEEWESRYEIFFGITMCASDYGLSSVRVIDDNVTFTRTR